MCFGELKSWGEVQYTSGERLKNKRMQVKPSLVLGISLLVEGYAFRNR